MLSAVSHCGATAWLMIGKFRIKSVVNSPVIALRKIEQGEGLVMVKLAAQQDSMIATVAIGYGDGSRNMQNWAP